MTAFIGRREFVTVLGGTAAAWRLAARAQRSARTRRIGVLMSFANDDPKGQAREHHALLPLPKNGSSLDCGDRKQI